MNTEPIILGIESSCDDTGAAVIRGRKILSNVIANQIVHKAYGGVVPELASRAHQQNILPVVHEALAQAGVKKEELSGIAYTRGPGLMGSLLVGSSFAKSLSMALEIPLMEVNHMQGHILAHFIEDANEEPPSFPFLCLTVSGGHTQIVKVKDYFDMEVLGETLDDAAGEAFDKAGKTLGLNYPSGPIIDKLAKEGDPLRFRFSKPRVDELNFSFSGLKTAILYFVQKEIKKNPDFIRENINDLSASIQRTITDILFDKLETAVKQTGITQVAIAGGVSANSEIRTRLKQMEEEKGWKVFIPKFEYTTDNAAMIAMTGVFKFQKEEFADLSAASSARYQL